MPTWCKRLQTKKVTKDKTNEIVKWVSRQNWSDLIFTEPSFCMMKIFKKIDKVVYDGEIFSHIFEAFDQVLFRSDIKDQDIGAFIAYKSSKVTDEKDTLVIAVNPKTFTNLFKKNDRKGYHAGGRLCTNRVECLVNILCHESVHLVLDICDRLVQKKKIKKDFKLDADKYEGHGPVFNSMVKKYWSQHDDTHALIPGLSHDYDLLEMKKRTKKDSEVTFHFDENPKKTKFLNGKVKKVFKDRVIIESDGHLYEVYDGKYRLMEKNV